MTDSRIILGYIIQAGARDLSQSLSSDTLQGISSEWSGDTTEVVYIQKSSHWLKQWPITNGLGDKKRRVVIGWRCNLDFVETLEQSTNGKFKRFRRSFDEVQIAFSQLQMYSIVAMVVLKEALSLLCISWCSFVMFGEKQIYRYRMNVKRDIPYLF